MTGQAYQQSGVVPYRLVEADERQVEILLITTRSKGIWSLPKGGIEPGMTPAESAENEAFEEAGAHGHTSPTELGVFSYHKRGFPIDVLFFPMQVTGLDTHWLEEDERQRRWVSAAKAMILLEPRGMTHLIQALLDLLEL